MTGNLFAKETVKQICVFKEGLKLWWEYIKLFEKQCIARLDMDNCTNQILEKLKANVTKIKDCYSNSFEGSDPSLDDNKLLRIEREAFVEEGIQILPSILINNVTFKVGYHLFIFLKKKYLDCQHF